MKKVILFDLYDTVLKNISFDFSAGIHYLYNKFFSNVCSLENMMDYANTFLPLYDKRKEENVEICLIKDEIPLYFKKFGVDFPSSWEELDYEIMNQMQKVTLTETVRFTLNELYEQNVMMYILSNSIFTGYSARKLLNDFHILHFFKKLYSSADYGIRKPSSKFYQIAIDGILSDLPAFGVNDILYIGNDYETDVLGASAVGLDVLWYNEKHLPNDKNINLYNIDNFKDILELVYM